MGRVDVGMVEFELRDTAPEKGDQTPVPQIWDNIRVSIRANEVIDTNKTHSEGPSYSSTLERTGSYCLTFFFFFYIDLKIQRLNRVCLLGRQSGIR